MQMGVPFETAAAALTPRSSSSAANLPTSGATFTATVMLTVLSGKLIATSGEPTILAASTGGMFALNVLMASSSLSASEALIASRVAAASTAASAAACNFDLMFEALDMSSAIDAASRIGTEPMANNMATWPRLSRIRSFDNFNRGWIVHGMVRSLL